MKYQDWELSRAHEPWMAHTWITHWGGHGMQALVAQARAESWDCRVIASGYHGLLTAHALAELRVTGTTIAIDPDEIQATLTAVIDRLRQGHVQASGSDQRPLLLLVDDGQHVENDMLNKIVRIGRQADIHVAIDERARGRTSREFQDNICGMYRL